MTPFLMLEQAALIREAGDFGGTATYAGADYPCSIGPMTSEARLTPGGFSPGRQTTIVIRKSVLAGATLKPGQSVIITDKRSVVRAAKIAPDGINDLVCLWQLTCEHPAQNA